ncbi:MAG: mannonate dehydratase [Thermomicrobiales bacterium]
MRIAMYIWPEQEDMRALAVQMGVTDAVTSLPQPRPGRGVPWAYADLVRLKQTYADAGLNASVIESSPPMDDIRLDGPNAEAETERICQFLTDMGAAGFEVWCYNWMAVFNWQRTSVTTRDRGGALVSSYDHDLNRHGPPTEHGEVSEEHLWETYQRFVERVAPVAEAAGVKMALHPDDPPLSPIRGVGRIMRSVENFQRALSLHESPVHGITFCQGNFRLMTEEIPATIHTFAKAGRMHFAHFRDVRGTVEKFSETFHDDGPTDMLAAMRAYHEAGFTGPIRPDHVPTLHGDANDPPGYTLRGRLYAVGYMRGLLEAVRAGC